MTNEEIDKAITVIIEYLAELLKRTPEQKQKVDYYPPNEKIDRTLPDMCMHTEWVDMENGLGQCKNCMGYFRYNIFASGGKRS